MILISDKDISPITYSLFSYIMKFLKEQISNNNIQSFTFRESLLSCRQHKKLDDYLWSKIILSPLLLWPFLAAKNI